MEMTRVKIYTEVEAYPVLDIQVDERGTSDVEVPSTMLDRLADAYDTVAQAELEIMRYVAERYPTREDVAEWLANQDEDDGDGEPQT